MYTITDFYLGMLIGIYVNLRGWISLEIIIQNSRSWGIRDASTFGSHFRDHNKNVGTTVSHFLPIYGFWVRVVGPFFKYYSSSCHLDVDRVVIQLTTNYTVLYYRSSGSKLHLPPLCCSDMLFSIINLHLRYVINSLSPLDF